MTPPPSPPTPTPRLTPTRPGSLALVVLVACVAAWALANRFYGDLPTFTWFPALSIALLAVFEVIVARATKAKIERQEDAGPVEPLAVARFAALAKASSLGGALFVGLYAGLLLYLLSERSRLAAAADDLPECTGGLIAAVLLVAAALWLERSCRIPDPPDDEES
ncbi:DUF3180 domain-containing protein [Cryptosporangium sp. NPDC051539]|uniref:DUF3180 domain-containing protein n=1 Tax=Cryptosporangium sp. NPDC051539 TaxID=3363962 RepID=UPI0037A8FED7